MEGKLMKLTKHIWWIALAVLALAASWFFWWGKPSAQDEKAILLAKYEFTTVRRGDLSETIDATGTVMAARSPEVYSDYAGTVGRITVRTGSRVRRGDIIMTIDSAALQSEWAGANSTLTQAQSSFTLADQALKRAKALYAIQGITANDLATAQNDYDIARDKLKLAQSTLNDIKKKPGSANTIDSQRHQVQIRAPFNGAVAWLAVKSGERIETATLLANIIADDSLYVQADIDESEIAKLKNGQTAVIFSEDDENTEISGRVFEIGAIGTADAGVVTFPVKIRLPRENTLLKLGMSPDVTITTQFRPNVLSVPAGAVVERRGKNMVPLWLNNQVVYTRVVTGLTIGSNIEILSGVAEGDILAVEKPKSQTTNGSNTNNNSNRNRPNQIRFPL
jgi:RND family efflux transporter MFP subunit